LGLDFLKDKEYVNLCWKWANRVAESLENEHRGFKVVLANKLFKGLDTGFQKNVRIFFRIRGKLLYNIKKKC